MAKFKTILFKRSLTMGVLSILSCAILAEGTSEDFGSVYGDAELVSIATGSKQPLAVAPAVATVLTEQDIRASGAIDIDDLLETVPGLYVGRFTTGYMTQYVMRGIFSDQNQQVLLLINGVPLTTLYLGNRGISWGGMPVRNIDRIEIIRGPGSAVYGADAFAGVINVITKNYETTHSEVGANVGSFGTKEAWWLQKAIWKDLKMSWSLQALRTKGHNEKVLSDLQTTFDGIFGTSVSEAPGGVNIGKDSLETHFDINYKDASLKILHQGRYHMETGAGLGAALDPRGDQEASRFIADFNYNWLSERSPWDVTFQATYLHLIDKGNFYLYPPGAIVFFTAPGVFPEGMRGAPENYERHVRTGLSAFYTGFSNHRVRMGTGAVVGRFYKARERKNFDATGAPLADGFVDVSGNPDLIFMAPNARVNRFAFLQDEWSFAQNWDLTLGIRGDWYSDFGKTINPRAAIVWQTTERITSKLLYGKAFRTPSFAEQHLINNPVAIGNSNLSPEIIDTLELAEFFKLTKNFNFNVNVFAYRMTDILRLITPTAGGKQQAQNAGRQWGHGLESEFEWSITDTIKALGNYAFQHATDRTTNADAGNAPKHQGYVRGEWQFKPKWFAALQSNLIGERKRVADDLREGVAGFVTLDATVRYGSREEPWSVGLILRNLTDKIARVPTISPGLIPGDLPLSGRAAFVEAELRL